MDPAADDQPHLPQHPRHRRLAVVALVATLGLGAIAWVGSAAVGTWACRYHETREGRPLLKAERLTIDDLPDTVPARRNIRYVSSDLPAATVLTISECNPSLLGRSRNGAVLIEVAAPAPTDPPG